MENLIGRTLQGKYRITKLLAEGGMGAVFQGVEASSQRKVAIKILSLAPSAELQVEERFQREIRMMRRVDHPNVVRVLDNGVDGDVTYLVMELIEGRNLGEILDHEGRLSEARATGIVLAVLDALSAAHAHRVVHRDIKPENVMLLPDGQVKLVDFGVAKRASRERLTLAQRFSKSRFGDDDTAEAGMQTHLTSVGMVVGSPGYMAPEQMIGTEVDARTDVYACGAMLYRTIVGRLPFGDPESPSATLSRDFHEPPRAPREMISSLHPALEEVMYKALRPRPKDRFQTAAEMAEAIRARGSEYKDKPVGPAAGAPIHVPGEEHGGSESPTLAIPRSPSHAVQPTPKIALDATVPQGPHPAFPIPAPPPPSLPPPAAPPPAVPPPGRTSSSPPPAAVVVPKRGSRAPVFVAGVVLGVTIGILASLFAARTPLFAGTCPDPIPGASAAEQAGRTR